MSLLVPVLAAAVVSGCGGGGSGVGPLAANVTSATAVGASVNVGKPASFGIPLYNRTDRVFTLDRAVAIGLVGPIAVDGIVVAGIPNGLVGAMRGYPPAEVRSTIRPVRGWMVASHSMAAQLLVGAHMTRPGTARITKIRLEYHSGRHRYSVDFPYSIGECAPYGGWPHGCPPIPLPT